MRVVMALENQSYPRDVRVRAEAEALARAGHDVTVLAPRGPGESRREEIAGVKVRRFRWFEASRRPVDFLVEYAIAHVQLTRLAAVELVRGADVLHLHNPPDTLFVAGLLARALRRRVVFDQHDLFPELIEERFGPSRLSAVARAAERGALWTASTVIVANESHRELVRGRGRVRDARITVVRNGPRRATLVDEVAVRNGALAEPRLVYVGELAPQDGALDLPALLEDPALAAARLTIVGDGASRAELEAAVAARPGLAERVRFTGRVAHARVPELLADADVAVDPAPGTPLNHRSTMIKIAEYLAAGLPVVAYDLVETRRTAGDAALYAPPGDAQAFAGHVARLAADPSLRRSYAQRGRARAEELVWERSERALLDAYDRLAAQGRR
jgi:glycosyltransferase involved in cell wall biosynthesis